MTAQQRVRRAGTALHRTAILGAAAGAVATAALVVMLGRLLHSSATGLAAVAALAVFLLLYRWCGPLRSPLQVALWVEQEQRTLRYALVAALQLEAEGRTPAVELSRIADEADVDILVRRASYRRLRPAVGAMLLSVAGLLLVLRLVPRAAAPAPTVGGPGATAGPSRLTPLRAWLRPPAYALLADSGIEEPDQILALAGSRIALRGAGGADGITLTGLRDTLTARDSSGWVMEFTMPAEPTVLTLRDREFRRLVTVLPRPDSLPEVVLRHPLHDTTYRTVPAEPISLEADASDDLGLASGYWEFLITAGSGDDQFETVTRIAGRVAFGNAREGVLRSSLRLDTMHLKPGSVINLRAIVLDANNLTGPGRGVSETRTLRIAPVIDSTGVAAEPAIPIDSMWMSQRLLNLRTDTLLLDRRRIKRAEFGSRSANLSNAQETIRGRVLAVVALLEDDGVGGAEPTEDSKLLRQAGDAMLNARFLLATAAPDSARPFMRRALAILDQIRLAKRYYIRGVIRPNPVDIASVRLTGTERGAPAPAALRPPLPLADRGIAERLARVVQLADTDPAAARDTLVFLQVQLLRQREDIAVLIGTALAAAKQGTPVAAALVPARRRLTPAPVQLDGSAEWSGGSAP